MPTLDLPTLDKQDKPTPHLEPAGLWGKHRSRWHTQCDPMQGDKHPHQPAMCPSVITQAASQSGLKEPSHTDTPNTTYTRYKQTEGVLSRGSRSCRQQHTTCS